MFQNYPRSRLVATLLVGQLALVGACAVRQQRGSLGVEAGAGASDCCQPPRRAESGTSAAPGLIIPDVELLDQDGQPVRFYTDFVQGKTVLISFFFTSCTTVCPTLTAIMSQVQRELLLDGRSDVQLISLSVDPVRDTPPRLKAWSRNFSARPGWVFLTGHKARVDRLLKALRTFTPDPQDHTPMVLIGNEPRGIWKQVNGLSSAGAIASAVRALAGKPPESDADSAPQAMPAPAASPSTEPGRKENESAHRYFGDVELQDQDGTTHRLYTDLMQGRVMLVNSFFSTCAGVCPVMAQKIKDIRAAFSDRVGKDFVVLSISVDPDIDTPARLNQYAKNLRAGAGWYFLTGTTDNIETALRKFGMNADHRENHSNLFLLGNDLTGSWKKAFSLAPTEELLPLVADVFNGPLPYTAKNRASNR